MGPDPGRGAAYSLGLYVPDPDKGVAEAEDPELTRLHPQREPTSGVVSAPSQRSQDSGPAPLVPHGPNHGVK